MREALEARDPVTTGVTRCGSAGPQLHPLMAGWGTRVHAPSMRNVKEHTLLLSWHQRQSVPQATAPQVPPLSTDAWGLPGFCHMPLRGLSPVALGERTERMKGPCSSQRPKFNAQNCGNAEGEEWPHSCSLTSTGMDGSMCFSPSPLP